MPSSQAHTKSLAFRIFVPVLLGFILAGGSLFFFLFTFLSDFMESHIRSDMEKHASAIYSIGDQGLNDLLNQRRSTNRIAIRIAQAKAQVRADNYMRSNDLRGVIKSGTAEIFRSADLPGAMTHDPAVRYQENMVYQEEHNSHKYYIYHIDFEPWKWQILLVKDAEAYTFLINKITTVYIVIAALLIFYTLFLLILLRKFINHPVKLIIEALKNGSPPRYKGIKEFTFLSENIADMMEKLKKSRELLEKRVEERTKDLISEIDKHIETEKTLRKSEQRLAEAQAMAHIGNWEWDIATDSFTWSEEIFRIFGVAPDSFIPSMQRVTEAIHPDDRSLFQAAVDKALKGQHLYALDFRIIRPGGDERTVHSIGELILNDSGSPSSMIGTIQDITERERAQTDHEKLTQRLQQSQKLEAVGTLAGGIAHDFNNILHSIFGHLQNLKAIVPDDAPGSSQIEGISLATRRAGDLVKQILIYGRRSEQNRKPILLQELIRETLQLTVGSKSEGITIHQKIDPDSKPIDADETQIRQVLMNLITNACQSMQQAGGTLEIGLASIRINESKQIHPDLVPGHYARFSISDTGHGIDPETLPRIFNPYFTTRTFSEGTGLGLAIAEGIIKSHGGVILVESTQGQGTTFQVYFPLLSSRQTVPAETSKEQTFSAAFQGSRILFVDDEKMNVETWAIALRSEGFKVTGQIDSREALKLFELSPHIFDLVITDQRMPDMSGLKLAEELLKIRPDIPVILSTGWNETLDSKQILAAGIQKVVQKPHEMKDLLQAIYSCLA
ncbi:MAG: response regulator [Proteobacteria bacterium]|nr:response regulator [Pseudomonadota bacterium]MBU1709338.1 response regulator [Pseudomonadota bacterium]